MAERKRQVVKERTYRNSILIQTHIARIDKLLHRDPDNLTVFARTVWGGSSLHGDEASPWEVEGMTRWHTSCLDGSAKL